MRYLEHTPHPVHPAELAAMVAAVPVLFEGPPLAFTPTAATGIVRGLRTTVEYTEKRWRKPTSFSHGTSIRVAVPTLGIWLVVVPGLSRRLVATGNADFDGRYVILGAPASVVRRLFDPSVTSAFAALDPLDIYFEADAIRVRWSGWVDEPQLLQHMVDVTRRLALRVAAVLEEDVSAATPGAGGDPALARERVLAAWAAEVRVARGRERRRALFGLFVVLVVLGGLLAALILFVKSRL